NLVVPIFRAGSSTWTDRNDLNSAPPFFYAAFSCGRTNRATTQRHRNCRAHHLKQNANASGGIKPLKLANKIRKWPRQDSHGLPGRQTACKERQIGLVGVLDQRFHDALRHGDWTILAAI